VINFQASLGFNPREASLERHSLKLHLDIADCFIVVDSLDILLKNLKKFRPERPTFRFPDNPTPTLSPSPFSISPYRLSPTTPNTELLFSPTSFIMSSSRTPSPPSSALEPYTSPTSPLFGVLSVRVQSHQIELDGDLSAGIHPSPDRISHPKTKGCQE